MTYQRTITVEYEDEADMDFVGGQLPALYVQFSCRSRASGYPASGHLKVTALSDPVKVEAPMRRPEDLLGKKVRWKSGTTVFLVKAHRHEAMLVPLSAVDHVVRTWSWDGLLQRADKGTFEFVED